MGFPVEWTLKAAERDASACPSGGTFSTASAASPSKSEPIFLFFPSEGVFFPPSWLFGMARTTAALRRTPRMASASTTGCSWV